ncbi:hypothetical protein ANN_00108 [Periplaneta americana]|uniref:Uncharacterized protein n=1 Tax=Periplaneta americana TaxID=6978 RepID=A0ABQ8TRP3_PERAM|nr:hypothetical protein ANN_00108 [Periplaneta americana]
MLTSWPGKLDFEVFERYIIKEGMSKKQNGINWKSYQDQLEKLRQELEAGREMRRQLEEKLRAAAEVRPNLEQMDSEGRTALHRAAERGDTHTVQLLLDAGSQVNAVDHDFCTPLWLAASVGRQDACRALLAAGARPDMKDEPYGGTALHMAAWHGHPAVCELLLAAGARPNQPDDLNQYTALHWAAVCGHAPVVQLLLQHGAERGARNKQGRTALDLARQSSKTEVAAMLQG